MVYRLNSRKSDRMIDPLMGRRVADQTREASTNKVYMLEAEKELMMEALKHKDLVIKDLQTQVEFLQDRLDRLK